MKDHDYRRQLLAARLSTRTKPLVRAGFLAVLANEQERVFINPATGDVTGVAGESLMPLPPGPLVELTADDLPDEYRESAPDTVAELLGGDDA